MKEDIKKTTFSLNGRRLSRIIALIMCAVLAVVMTPGVSEPVFAKLSDANSQALEARIDALNQEWENVQAQITDTKDDIQKAINQKQKLDKEMDILIQKVEITNQLIEELKASIAQKDAEITDKSASYEKRYRMFKERLRITHEEGRISYLQMLFGSASLSEFLSRIDRIGSMIRYDTELMDQLKSEKTDLETARADYQMKKEAQEKYLAQLKADEAALEKKKIEAANYLAALQSNEKTYKAMLARIDEAEQKLQAELEAYLKKLQEMENAKYVGGKFMWPLPAKNSRVSSVYGGRTSPITGKWEFHNGIDIPAAYGTDIYAANAGTVTIATYHWSYGNYIMVDHGGGYATLYAHCSQLLVSKGQKVKQGDVIAKVGSSGSSTGNHLHFSLYESSKHTDPLKLCPAPKK